MFWTACKIFFALAFLTGCLYPLLVTEIAKLTMPHQANGSLILINQQLRGSQLIVQPFKEDRYFWPRPSTLNYDTLHSYGSNLGPTSRRLKEIIQQREQILLQAHPYALSVPSDLLYASGSGLDPHISVEAAYFQMERIAHNRSLSSQAKEQLRQLIDQSIEGKNDLWGPPHLNVLLLNMALDQYFSHPSNHD